MSSKLSIIDYAGSTESERDFLRGTFGSFTRLAEVLDWMRALDPPALIEVVTQDEYTHDVLVTLPDGRCLDFDST